MRKLILCLLAGMTVLTLSACKDSNEILEEYNPQNAVEIDPVNLQYSTNTTKNIILPQFDVSEGSFVTDILGNELYYDDVVKKDVYFEIKSDYILGLDRDVVSFYFYAGSEKTLINITVNDQTTPYIISSSFVTTDGTKDLVFQFDLFGGSIDQVSGAALTSESYLIEENILTFTANYIDSQFESADEFTISYTLINNDNLILGLLDFTK